MSDLVEIPEDRFCHDAAYGKILKIAQISIKINTDHSGLQRETHPGKLYAVCLLYQVGKTLFRSNILIEP